MINEVERYWNGGACGSRTAKSDKFSSAYFQEIEEYRYSHEPMIHAFAQFTRWRGKKVLEVGYGAGTDLRQFIRAGADVYGIDLTAEAYRHVRYCDAETRTGSAEYLPYDSNMFDLVYSWGVIHHTPDTEQALAEIIRVCKAGGAIKIMVYNRHSLAALYKWVKYALLKGRVFWNFSDVLFYQQESIGTKAYTRKEIEKMVSGLPVKIKYIWSPVDSADLNKDQCMAYRAASYVLACIFGFERCGWYMMVEMEKTHDCR